MAARIKRARGWATRPKVAKPPRKQLSMKPYDLTEDAWFYDQRGGIELTIWTTARVNKGERQADNLTISWAKLRAALARNDKL